MTRRIQVSADASFLLTAAAGLPAETPEPPLRRWLSWLEAPGPWKWDPAAEAGGDFPQIGIAPPSPGDGPWSPAELTAGQDPAPPVEPGANPLPGLLRAGECVVEGEISDVTTLEPIAGAIVTAMGTGREDETDSQGRFRIAGLPEGETTLEALKLGYSSGTAVVVLRNGSVGEARIALRVKPDDTAEGEYLLPAESIVGEYTESNQGDFNLQLAMDTPTLAAGLSREEFKENVVSDAGEAIAKVSGANIVDGKYAVVRGLADRYITTTFNGAMIASADPSRKAVQLDLFPTNVIQAINVDKTYAPHLSGDFGGGAIDIITRSLPEERILDFTFRLSVNDGLEDGIYVHPNRSIGTFGDLGPGMPPVLEGQGPDGTPFFYDTGTLSEAELAERWRTLHDSSGMRPVRDDAEPGYSMGMTYGETFELANGMKLGVIGSAGYSKGDESNTSPVTNPVRTFQRDDYERGVEWVVFGSAALEMNDWNVLQGTYMRRIAAKDEVSHSRNIIDDEENLNYGGLLRNSAVNPANDYGPDAIYYGTAWDIAPLSRDLQIMQLSGKHGFTERGMRFNWSITDSTAVESRPHSTHFEYGTLDFSSKALAGQIARVQLELDSQAVRYATALRLPNPQSYNWQTIRQPMIDAGRLAIYNNFENSRRIIPDDTRAPVETIVHGEYSNSVPGKQRSSRRSEETTEDAFHSQFGATLPFYFEEDTDDRRFELGFGLSHLKKSRNSTARQYDLFIQNNSLTDPGYPSGVLNGPGGRGEELALNPGGISADFTGSSLNGPFYLNGLVENGLENIDTRLDQKAHYISGRLDWDNFFLLGGARFEEETYEIDIAGVPLSAFTDDQIASNLWESRDAEESVLPSLTAGLKTFDDRLGWLVAWSETVARPTFWEFIPSQTYDQAAGIGRRGNNTLQQTEISNYDIAVTYAPSERLSFRTSLFHKDLVNPLVTFFDEGILFYSDAYIDPATGGRTPFEATINGIEFEVDIQDIGPFSLKGNFTYISAVLDYTYVVAGVPTQVSSQLPYQPETILNLNLGYEHEPWDTTANLILNFTGDYPTVLKRTPADFEIRRDPITTLDLVISKTVETSWAEYVVRGGVKNLLDAVDTYYFGDDIFYSDQIGRSYFLEIEARF